MGATFIHRLRSIFRGPSGQALDSMGSSDAVLCGCAHSLSISLCLASLLLAASEAVMIVMQVRHGGFNRYSWMLDLASYMLLLVLFVVSLLLVHTCVAIAMAAKYKDLSFITKSAEVVGILTLLAYACGLTFFFPRS